MSPMFLRFESEKSKARLRQVHVKTFGSNTGKPYLLVCWVENKFSKRESMPLDSGGAFAKTAVKQ